MSVYAQIQANLVINIILASSGDYFDPTYTWINITSVTPQPSIGWSYIDSVFSPPSPSYTLEQAQTIVNAQFINAVNGFVESRYSLTENVNILDIYINANINGLTNRFAYIAPLSTWKNSIITYTSSILTEIQNAETVEDVFAITWDFSSFISSDPTISSIAALLIDN